MTQETEREDPRQAPPKQFANERPGSEQTPKAPASGGLRDDTDDARGAFDDDRRSGKESDETSRAGGNPAVPPSKGGAADRPKDPSRPSGGIEPGRAGGPSVPNTGSGSSGTPRPGEKR
jgi:hypothetical protein